MEFDCPQKNHIPQLVSLWQGAFGDCDGFWELFLDTGFLPDHCRCITENNQVIAGLYWFGCRCEQDKIAYIYGVVTDPRHRGKGLCRMLIRDVHNLLKKEGYASAMLVPASPGLRQMYRKMGYEDCTNVREWKVAVGDTAEAVRSVGIEEYARLRRNLLPGGSVLQEGIQLPFLAAQAQLFAGEDFLLAAYREEDSLHGMEFLGNSEKAPGILRALGCTAGNFRMPGDEIPFAMLCKLTEKAVTPAYFGFSFD